MKQKQRLVKEYTDADVLSIARAFRGPDSGGAGRIIVSLCRDLLATRNTSSSLTALQMMDEELNLKVDRPITANIPGGAVAEAPKTPMGTNIMAGSPTGCYHVTRKPGAP